MITNKVPVYDKNRRIIGVAMAYYSVDSTSDSPTWSQRLTNVIDYVHHHYAEQVKSETLAQIARVSETHLKRIFNRLFGMPPIEYLILTRVNAARDLLETTDRTISDIAQEVGFYDHSHFIRHFRRLRGCTPNQYRKQYEAREKPARKEGRKRRRRPTADDR
jgi:AraC-like DNA-binding protein